MSKYHIEVLISEGDKDGPANWKTLADVLVMNDNSIESGKQKYDLNYQIAALKAVETARKELLDE